MDLVQIHTCLCDRTRLRLLNLLLSGPLCVCHFQDVLGEPQVKISKHLAFLKRHALVEATRCGQWMVYQLPEKRPRLLAANLACLQDCAAEDRQLRADSARLDKLRASFAADAPAGVRAACCDC